MWTKIPYMTLSEAMKPQFVNGVWKKAALGGRYRNVLRKEFLKAGVPWEFEQPKSARHPFHRAPKGNKDQRTKKERVERIIKALERQPEIQLEHRKKIAKEKPLTGLDYLAKQTMIWSIKKK